MIAFARAIGVGLLLLVIFLIARWPSLVSLGFQHDLNSYAKTIRASDQMLEQKERLLDRIDAVEGRLVNGARLPMLCWQGHDEAIQAMLDDGITSDEVRLIERELEKIERELSQ